MVAAVAEVEVNCKTGTVRVTRVCVGHDCGQIINPDGLANQIEGGVIPTVSRTLLEQVEWGRTKVTSVDWTTYPILRFPDAPRAEVDMINIPGEVSWGAGEPTATTIPAAITNAICDATGVRIRPVPFTPEKVLAAQRRQGRQGLMWLVSSARNQVATEFIATGRQTLPMLARLSHSLIDWPREEGRQSWGGVSRYP